MLSFRKLDISSSETMHYDIGINIYLFSEFIFFLVKRTKKIDSKIKEKLTNFIVYIILALSLIIICNLCVSFVFGHNYQFIESTRGSFILEVET